jgi:tRNA(Ile)-lysidine synthase
MHQKEKIEHKVRDTISRYELLNKGDQVIVAVSGGPDSVCLLHILQAMANELALRLVVAHFDHGLRPADDADETAFVHALAQSMDLPFETAKATQLKREGNGSLEERAREVRYAFLDRVRSQYGAQKIALGHNINDQGETVIMRLLRGAGSLGLAGIPPKRENRIIRPLISLSREEILSYLKERGLPYKTDWSNLDQAYLRNKIRLGLMPLLLEYQPRLIEHLSHLADILREEGDYLDNEAQRWLLKEGTLSQGRTSIPIPPLRLLPRAMRYRVVRRLLMGARRNLRRINWDHVEAIDTLIRSERPQGTLNLPRGVIVKKTYDTLYIDKEAPFQPVPFHYVLEGPGRVYLKETNQTLSLAEISPESAVDLGKDPNTAYLDKATVHFPLIVRQMRPGDRFMPLGMRGRKKIKDLFIDEKIPSEIRRKTLLLVSRESILWVCGYRMDERYKVTEDTKRILRATIRKGIIP